MWKWERQDLAHDARQGSMVLRSDEGGGKIMVPRRGIDGSGPRFLENGAKVTYEAIQGREGMEAKSVSTVWLIRLEPARRWVAINDVIVWESK
jgi:cold shock protein